MLTLLLLEGVLSFDNAAILAAMVRKLPQEQRRKALLYGLAGAYVFRVGAILSVAWIIGNPIVKLLGGAYLIWLAAKHFLKDSHTRHPRIAQTTALMGAAAFWGVVIRLEMADLAFALDQVLVAVALTDKIVLIIVASLFAILLLRLSAFYMTRLMDWFPALEHLAYVAVGWVGVKLVAVDVAHRLGFESFDVPKSVSIGVTLMVLVVPVVVKFAMDKLRPKAVEA